MLLQALVRASPCAMLLRHNAQFKPCDYANRCADKYWAPWICLYDNVTGSAPKAGSYTAFIACKNPGAVNFVPWADISDESLCTFRGCNDTLATNTDPQATFFDGTCEYDRIGCTDPTAANYAKAFTLSCQFA